MITFCRVYCDFWRPHYVMPEHFPDECLVIFRDVTLIIDFTPEVLANYHYILMKILNFSCSLGITTDRQATIFIVVSISFSEYVQHTHRTWACYNCCRERVTSSYKF